MSLRKSPRFDLFFEGGSCIVKARGPISAGPARIEELSMNTEIRGAFDMRGGTERVRHRRSRLGSTSARVPFSSLSARAAPLGLRVRFEALKNGLRIELEDEIGVLCVEGRVGGRGADLLFIPTNVRWFRAGPTSAWDRLLAAAQRVGVPFEVMSGAFVVRRPLRLCMAQALLPQGWRLPDDRSVYLEVTFDAQGFRLRSQKSEPDRTEFLEQGRVFAAALEAEGGRYAGMRAPATSPLSREEMENAEGAEAHIDAEPGRWLRADATLLVAERSAEVSPTGDLADAWQERVFLSLAVFSGDLTRHRSWAHRWAGAGNPLLLRLLASAWAGPLARLTRATFAAEVIVIFAAAADPLAADDESHLLALAQRCRDDAPDQPLASAALAAVHARREDVNAATELYVRAADLETRGSQAAEWRRLGAEQAMLAHGAEAAERLLEQALVESKGNARILVELAQAVAEQGDDERASELLGRLLRGTVHDVTHEDALVAAARFHVERGQADEAHPFLVRLGPSLAGDAGAGAEINYEEEFQSAELSIEDLSLGDEDSMESFDDALFEEAFPSQVFERPELEMTGVREEPAEEPRFRPVLVEAPKESPSLRHPEPPAPAIVTHVSGPEVTIVATTGDGLRALLDELKESEDPEALLEGALEGAIASDDMPGVMDVLRALDRVENLRGELRIRGRAERFRDEHNEPEPDEHA
ncbi:MAG: tetratricopeptide repeat protein [Polyangiales bacterium]